MINSLKRRLIKLFHKHSLPRWMVLLIDLTVVWFSFLVAYILRYNFDVSPLSVSGALHQSFLVLVVYLIFMLVFQSYAGMIRHTTIRDTYKIIFTTTSALAVLFTLTLLSRRWGWNSIFDIPLSILLIHSVTVVVLLFCFRVFVKMFYEFATSTSHTRKNAIIYGSGDMGIVIKRLIEGDSKSNFRIIGFIDDDRNRQGKRVDGYPVYSRHVLTKEFFENEDISTFIIAINKIAPIKKKEVIESVINFGCEILDTPSFDTWLNGQLDVKNLKKVNLEDLLGREPIMLDLEQIEQGLRDKVILVTGAAGSIGSEIARQLTRFNPNMLILVDQAETPSFYLQEELKKLNPKCNYKVIIGDVTRLEVMDHIFKKFQPSIVYHAAAYKHVPIMEVHPHEAFRVNVGGTKNIADLSINYGVKNFVMVSTDKAVNPTNVMGATKKICELLVHAYSKRTDISTKFITTRFGNVLGSNGSVIPLFNKQIADGGPVTITHPDITRYFMTIPEACQLVLEAGFMGNGGQIYVFDMGDPIKIIDIAYNLIRLSGLEPDLDIKIKFMGLRPGEKLYEELFSEGEIMLPTHNPKINIAQIQETDFQNIIRTIEKILGSLYKLTEDKLIEKMQEIVPGYTSKSVIVGQSI
jgi:FlaA1/EpsC-like NDP-sugar epimerase